METRLKKRKKSILFHNTLTRAHCQSRYMGVLIVAKVKTFFSCCIEPRIFSDSWEEQVGHCTFLTGSRLFKLREEYIGSSCKPGFPIIVRIVSIAPVVPKTFETIGATHWFPYNRLDHLSARSSTKITGSDIITLLKCIEFWGKMMNDWRDSDRPDRLRMASIFHDRRNRPDRLHFYPDDCDRPNRPASRHTRFHMIVSIT